MLAEFARTAWLHKHGEVAATTGLAYLLQQEEAAAAVTELIMTYAGVNVGGQVRYVAEARQADGGRADLEGRCGAAPALLIEAKFDAALTIRQLGSYATSQRRRLDGTGLSGVIALLVPSHRIPEMMTLVERHVPDGQAVGERAWRHPSTGQRFVVLTWNELLQVVAQALSGDVNGDVAQLRGLCGVLSDLDLRPLRGMQAEVTVLPVPLPLQEELGLLHAGAHAPEGRSLAGPP